MILYLDTSALVKRYFQEPFTEKVLSKWQEAEAIVTSSVTYAETLAAIYRKKREASLDTAITQGLVKAFHKDWESMIRVDVCDELNPNIHSVLQHHALRGFDAVHLASALVIQEQVPGTIFFACFDQQLNQAAQENGFASF